MRPFVSKGYASEWPACNKWPDKDYLVKTAGPTLSSVMTLSVNDEGKASMYDFNPRRKEVSLAEAIHSVKANDLSRVGKDGQLNRGKNAIVKDRKFISFMDEVDMTPMLRPDFKLPLL